MVVARGWNEYWGPLIHKQENIFCFLLKYHNILRTPNLWGPLDCSPPLNPTLPTPLPIIIIRDNVLIFMIRYPQKYE